MPWGHGWAKRAHLALEEEDWDQWGPKGTHWLEDRQGLHLGPRGSLLYYTSTNYNKVWQEKEKGEGTQRATAEQELCGHQVATPRSPILDTIHAYPDGKGVTQMGANLWASPREQGFKRHCSRGKAHPSCLPANWDNQKLPPHSVALHKWGGPQGTEEQAPHWDLAARSTARKCPPRLCRGAEGQYGNWTENLRKPPVVSHFQNWK